MSEPAAVTDAGGLFKLPLAEFTAARNALSAQLKKAGRADEAAAVKALAKPSISAWAVNQLYWRHRKPFDRLIEAGERLRRAQLKGDSTRDAIDARRAAIVELAGIAATVLRDGHFSATLDMLRRITMTLEALSSYGSLQGAPTLGRLVDELEPPGFEAVAGLLQGARVRAVSDASVPRPTRPVTKPQQSPDKADAAKAREAHKRLLVAAKEAVRDAERAAGAARTRAERAAAESDAAMKRAKAAEREREQLEQQLARVARDAAAAQERARKTTAEADEAAGAAAAAERALALTTAAYETATRRGPSDR